MSTVNQHDANAGRKECKYLPGLSPVAADDLVRRNFTADRPDAGWLSDSERHEALFYRVEVKGLDLRAVAAARVKLRAA